MTGQLTFDWPTGVALGPDDFFVSRANEQAYAMVNDPITWPDGKLVVVGPSGCGKSHLARVFEATNDATLIEARNIQHDTVISAKYVVIEDMEALHPTAEEAMFHLHNNLRAAGGTLLMTAQAAPSRWPIKLPDLASRMQATTVALIADPDDALLSALIMKLFADRQIMPPPPLVAYLGSRIERSFAAAADIVARIDEAALSEGRPVNQRLAARLLDNPTSKG